MIEEPVVNLSDSRTSPTSGEVQITISSAKRDRCIDVIDAADRVSSTKSRSETASSELAIGRSKPSAFAVALRSIGKEVPASAAAPSGDFVQALAGIGEPPAVARRHLDIGQQMMPERNRLRGLQMGEARHHGVGVLQRPLHQRMLKRGQRRIGLVDGVADIEPKIGRDLIVARTRGVQPACGWPDQFAEPALDIHVNVLERTLEIEGSLGDL